MQLVVESENKLKKIGEFQTESFKIKASAKAFSILSDSLYADKFSAILRELSCNAVDVHKSIKQTKKYEIHLPTWSQPNFWIRDYGTGLSKEDIKTVYTTYFESTKSESNDYIGCLGLGSKTPFSYTSQFTITSFFKGTKYCFSAHINDEDGCPSVSLLGETETTESDGLKVEFPVKSEDHEIFHEKAENVFAWFSELPKFSGRIPTITSITTQYIINGIDWHIYSEKTYPYKYRDQSYVKMGNIAYPIDRTKLPNNFPYMKYLDTAIILDMDIGDVDIAPSRESLTYNKKTIDVLTARFARFAKEAAKRFNEEIATKECYADACRFCIKQQYWQNKLFLLLVESDVVSYNGRNLQRLVNSYEITNCLGQYYDKHFFAFEERKLSGSYHNHYYDNEWKVIDLDEKCSRPKLKEILLHNEEKFCYILDRKIPVHIRENFIDLIGFSEKSFKEFSSLEKPPKEEKPAKLAGDAKQAAERKKDSQAWVYNPVHLGYCSDREKWKESEVIDFTSKNSQKYVYVHLQAFNPSILKHKVTNIDTYKRYLNYIDDKSTIFGLNQRQVDKISSLKNWKNIDDYLLEEYEKRINKIDLDKFQEARFINRLGNSWKYFFKEMPDCKLKKLYLAIEALPFSGSEAELGREYLYMLRDFKLIELHDKTAARFNNTILASENSAEFIKKNDAPICKFIKALKDYPAIFLVPGVDSLKQYVVPSMYKIDIYKEFKSMFHSYILEQEK